MADVYLGPPRLNTPPSTPTDSNAASNSIAEGASINSVVGITASSSDIAGSAMTYSLTSDSSGGGFKINPDTGVVTVADPTKIDFETSAGHAYAITVQASNGTAVSSQSFTIAVSDVAPAAPVDANAAVNTVVEGAAAGTTVGVTASSHDINGPAVTYSLTGDTSGGGFTINSATGVVAVADASKIDFESSPGHAYTVTAQASDGTLANSQTFTIAVTDVAISAPADVNNAANSVAEGAANGTTVGITASALDPNGPATSYSLSDSAGGRFAIDSSTGVVTVANGAAIDFETAAGHAYGITVLATNGAVNTSSAFSIAVTDIAPSAPADTNGATNSVFEGAANGTVVGITASSSDPGGGPAPTYSLTDNAGGRFAIDTNTGIVTVANGAAIDFETATGHAYGITVQATAGALSSTQNFSIAVANVNEAPAGTDKTVTILEGASYTFGVADFGFSDPSDSSAPNSLLNVKMTTVPGAGTGTLTDNGISVNAGDFVSATDIGAGHLIFTPTAHANGSPEAAFTFQVQDNGGTANGGVDLDQSPNAFTFNVTAVDDAPVNAVPGTQNVNEDATLTFSTGNGNAITISDVDVGSGNETVTLAVTSGTLALGSTAGLASFTNNAASITLSGTVANVNAAMNGLTYHGNLNFNGADTLVVSTNDNGNTGAGGPKTDTDSVTVNVAPVNDAPVNSVPGPQTVNEDTSLVFTGANAITISDVDGGTGDETVTLTVTSGTLALGTAANLTSFTNNAASITLTGTIAHINTALDGLSYHGNLNFNGADSLSIVTHDNGNTGGGDLTDTDSVTINVTAVNDAPSFAVGSNQIVLEDSGAHTVNGFATVISSGPANEAGQTVNFLTSNDNNALFTAQPTIDASGNLTYTLAANANGSASVTVQLHDNGGTANGGVDTSAAQSFNITANPVNDAPAGTDNTLTTLEDTSHTFTAAEFGFTDPVDAANNSGANNFLDIIVTTVPGAAAGTLSDNGVTLAAGGTVTKADIDTGLLKFNPAANANGNGEATFTFQVKDDGGTANGGVDTDQSPNTIILNVTSVNDAPAGTDTTIASVGAHTFAASEFGFTDPVDAGSAAGANALQAVIITTIPGAGTGTLTLDTGGGPVAVTAGESIAVGNIGGLVFTPVGNTIGSFTFQVQDNGGTANGGIDTDQSPNAVTVTQNTPPVANDDSVSATEAGGLNNAVAGVNPSGNVILGTGAAGDVQDTDAQDPSSALTVVAVHTGPEGASIAAGTVNSPLVGSHGTLTLNTDGSYAYVVNQTDAQVQGLRLSTDTLTDSFNYTIQDTGGLQDKATLTITIHGADDTPIAVADTTTAVEAGGIANGTAGTNPTGNVLTNDTDVDSVANGETKAVQGVASGSTNAVLTTNVGSDVTGSFGKLNISSTGAYTYTVDNTNATVQALRQSTDTLTDTFSYTMKDAAGATSTTQVTVTIDGANDNPVANADTANVTEASGTANGTAGTNITSGFNVLTGTGAGSVADTDVDTHGETQAVTGVETGSHPADVVSTGASAPLTGQYGTLTLSTNGSYTYTVDNSNATVDALNTGNHVDDVFTYTMQDAAGATSTTTLTIHVNGADDAPVAAADSGYVPTESRAFTVNAATGVLANDTDVDTAHASLTAVLNAGPSHAASFTLNSDGSFNYTPTTGYLGADSFTYHANDGSLSSNVVTVSLDVQPLVWHIDNSHSSADPTQDGSAAHPFQSIAAFDAANAAAGVHPDIVYLHNGTGTYTEADGINLNNGQTLIGQGAALAYQTSASSPGGVQTVTLIAADPAHTPTIVATAGDGIDLAQNNTVEGLHIGNTSGIGIADNGGTVGTLNISGVDINTNHQAVSLTHGGALNVTLDSITSTGGTNGITLGGALTGSFTGTTGTLSGHTGAEFSLNGGAANVSYGGAIGDGSGTTSVSIVNTTGGTDTLSGNITDSNDTGGGIGISGNSGTTINFTGTSKALNTGIGDGVSISSNTGSTVNFTNGGLTVQTTNGTAFSDSVAGTVSVTGSGNTLSTTGTGTALNLSHVTVGAGGVTFDSASTTGAANGIVIDTVTGGAITVNGGTISGATSNGVDINAAQNNISIASSITSTSAGHSVQVTGSGSSAVGGNTISFSGAVTDPGLGVNLDNNDQNTNGATVNFSGGLNIHSTTNTGFSATNGGTVNVTNGAHNSITSTTGTALDVANTTIGGSGLTFHDISAGTAASGPANAIILNNTGAGGLTVTGSGNTSAGGDNSGGTIQKTTGDAISLTDANNVSLTNMHITNTAGDGIDGTTVGGFTFNNSTIDGSNGTSVGGVGQGDIYFSGLSGSASIAGSKLTGAVYDALHVFNDGAQTLDRLTLTGDTFATNSAAGNSSNSAVDLEATGGTFNATVTGSNFTSSRSDMFHLNLLGTVSSDLVFGGSTAALGNTLNNSNLNIVSGAGGIDVGGGGTNNDITLTYNIAHNTISGASGADIAVSKGTGTGASFSGTIDSNTIGTQGVADSGSSAGDGIFVGVDGAGTSTTTITNNQIHGVDEAGIHFLNENGSGKLNATIQTNTIDTLDQTDGLAGMYLQTGANGSNDNNISNLTIGGAGSLQNSIDIGTNNNFAVIADIVLLQNGSTKVGLPGYPGTPNNTTAVQNFVTGNNHFVSTANAQAVDALTHAPGGYFGTAQLLAADGGVASASGTPGELHLTQSELDSVVQAAITDWAAAGATSDQLAALQAATYTVADLPTNTLGLTSSGLVQISTDAAGNGWFVDPSPLDNAEFTHALNAAGTDLLTDPTQDAAGHMDLLTTVLHEMGHVLGLPDSTATADASDLMYINLVDGERRLPDAADVAQAAADTASQTQAVEGVSRGSTQPLGGAPIVAGTAGNDTIDAGFGGKTLVGGAGADNFVFGSDIHLSTPTAPSAQPITHVADYSAAQGDTFDFSALTSAFHASGIADASLVRAVEDPSGSFATLQLNTNSASGATVNSAAPPSMGPPSLQGTTATPNWVNVAQIDGAQAGDPINVLVDSHAAIHLAQIHVDLLV